MRVAQQILDEMDRLVLSVGELLDSIYEDPAQFEDWIIEHMPLHPATAERIRAMWHLHQFRPGHPDLPEPHKALWSLDY